MKYVIQIQDQDDEVKYVGGSTEGSRYSLVSTVQRAEWFDTMEGVDEVLKHPEMTKRVGPFISSGLSAPPSLIWSGLGICNNRPKADGYINIIKIEFERVGSVYVKDQFTNVHN